VLRKGRERGGADRPQPERKPMLRRGRERDGGGAGGHRRLLRWRPGPICIVAPKLEVQTHQHPSVGGSNRSENRNRTAKSHSGNAGTFARRLGSERRGTRLFIPCHHRPHRLSELRVAHLPGGGRRGAAICFALGCWFLLGSKFSVQAKGFGLFLVVDFRTLGRSQAA